MKTKFSKYEVLDITSMHLASKIKAVNDQKRKLLQFKHGLTENKLTLNIKPHENMFQISLTPNLRRNQSKMNQEQFYNSEFEQLSHHLKTKMALRPDLEK